MKTQKQKVLEQLQVHGSITPMGALKQYGCFRLASVIHKLRAEGFKIKTKLIKREGPGKACYAKYTMDLMPF